MNRRNFLVGLFAAQAIIKLDRLMPIRVWRPTFYITRNIGMGPFLHCRESDLLGLDLGLPKPGTFSGSPGQVFWRLGSTHQSAGFGASATSRQRTVDLALAELKARLQDTPRWA